MPGAVFRVLDNGELVRMTEQPYKSEADLQALIEKYPSLLSGDDTDDPSDRRWVLIKREAGVPGEEDGADRWSADHFLVDHDGIPTIVEVKRSTDTRARREVVAQMLDYAANAVSYWGVGKIQGWYEGLCRTRNEDPAEALNEAVGWEDYEAFWRQVEENLQTGRVRMLWVADVIPDELRRIVEFLNEQMNPTEALAVEMRQFIGDEGTMVLAPRQIGSTVAIKMRKRRGGGEAKQLTYDEIMENIESHAGSKAAMFARHLKSWADEHGVRSHFAREWVVYTNEPNNGYFPFFYVLPTGHVRFRLRAIEKGRGPLSTEDKRQELLDHLLELGVPQESTIRSAPKLSMKELVEFGYEEKFLELLSWMLEHAQGISHGADSGGDGHATGE